MKLTYQSYVAQMRGFRQTPMSEIEFNLMEGIETDKAIEPLKIRPKKDSRPIDATFSNHVSINT